MKSLLLLLMLNTPWAGRWAIPTSLGGVLQNLDRPATRLPATADGVPAPAVTSEMRITITVRTRPDVTLICRTRGAFFNHDLPGERPDPDQPGAECAQVTGEKGTERIEDTGARRGSAGPATSPVTSPASSSSSTSTRPMQPSIRTPATKVARPPARGTTPDAIDRDRARARRP